MGTDEPGRSAWQRLRARIATYLANDDPLVAAANGGAFLVWSSQPFYPLYVWLLVGRDAWPSLVTWLSTPFFVAVPIVGRRNAVAGRALFVATGVANTLLSTKAFGIASEVGWFLVPCAAIALAFFRKAEGKLVLGLTILVIAAIPLVGTLGAPLHVYDPTQYRSLARLNLWSVVVLSVYLLTSAVRARRRSAGG